MEVTSTREDAPALYRQQVAGRSVVSGGVWAWRGGRHAETEPTRRSYITGRRMKCWLRARGTP